MKIMTRILRHLSIRGLVLLSVGMTLLPLLMGLVSAIVAVDRLAVVSNKAIQGLASEAKASQHLQERVNELERQGWKFLLFRDADSLSDLRLVHEQFEQTLQGFIDTGPSADSRYVYGLDALAREENNVFDSIVSRYFYQTDKLSGTKQQSHEDAHQDIPPMAVWFQSLRTKVSDLPHDFGAHVEQQIKSLDAQTERIKRRLIIDFALLLPVLCVLLAIFYYLLHSPMRQIDHAIRALAAGNFTQAIRVVGTTDMEFLGGRLEWLRTRLNDLEMAKQRFVRNVSHEIKTPLATIHEGTDLLLDEVVGELNQEQKHIARILISNADKLDRLIAELIYYSQVSARIEYQKLALVDMRLLVLNLLDDYQLQLRGKSIKVVDSLEALEIMGNKEQLRTIVDNLVSNAVKYSPPGGEIRISLRKAGGHMELEIEDDGPGIDPDERPRVFEPFFQGRASRELGVKGTGFGLAIVAECVASHHGKVEALESRDDRAGALFRIQIPMQSVNY